MELLDPERVEPWRLVTDQVMGGVSQGTLEQAKVAGRACLRMTGEVRLEHDGGFVQMARDLDPGHGGWEAIALDVLGDGEEYEVRLKTHDLSRPWQSFRHPFTAGPDWERRILSLDRFEPHRTDEPLRLDRLRRIGLIAIGRRFDPCLCVSRVALR